MAQRPTADFNIDPNITSGTDLANILNRFQDAIDSGNSGASRPAYLAAGGLWVREGDPMRLYLYDGTTDRELYNTTDGIVGGIPDGTVDGQITTWNASSGEWTPEDAVVIDANGNVGVGINPYDTLGRLQVEEPVSTTYTPLDFITNPTVSVLNSEDGAGTYSSIHFNTRTNGEWAIGSVQNASNTASDFVFAGRNGSFRNEYMRIDANGNVGINEDAPLTPLHVKAKTTDLGMDTNLAASFRSSAAGQGVTIQLSNTGSSNWISSCDGALAFGRGGFGEHMRIAASGRVGIGGQPSRSTKEIEEEAEATLRNWDSKDKKPTKAELIKKLTERDIGGGSAKLQVSGDGYFSGPLYSSQAAFHGGSITRLLAGSEANNIEITFSGMQPPGMSMAKTTGDTTFRGTVDAGAFTVNGSPLTRVGDIIETFRTLKNAVSDETTVEGIKEALTNSLGGLIEKFEAMQSAATQEIES